SVRIANQQDLDQSLNDPLRHFERYQEGDSIAATFATFRQQQSFETRLIGVTQQLVGCPEVNASRFQYCGSIGPLVSDFDRTLEFLGQRISETFCFHGVWGLDAVVSRGQVVPVDVNPRPTASSELFQSCFADLSQTIPNLLALHLAIHHRQFGPREFHAAIDSVRSKLQEFKNAKVILFNDKLDRQIPFDTWSKLASWFRPDFFTNVEFEGWSLADIPPCPGQSDDFLTLPSSAPILTICLRTKDEDPQKKLVDLADKIYQFINSK
ncbi:MAG: ATP-grasp domain-containing protein, partial [Planctomycetota bacterium]